MFFFVHLYREAQTLPYTQGRAEKSPPGPARPRPRSRDGTEQKILTLAPESDRRKAGKQSGTLKSKETLYRWFTRLTKRLSERQLIMILAVVVGVAAGVAGHLLRGCIHLIKQGLTSWADIEAANVLYFLYPMVGIAVTVLFVTYWVKDDISHGVTRIFTPYRAKNRASSRTTVTPRSSPAPPRSVSAAPWGPRRRSC